jgi:cytochrome c553
LAAALAALGLLAAVAGLVPIAASSGHWPITASLLHFTMRRSVATRALGIRPPVDLADPALVLKGARHFATGCAPCHGAPSSAPSGVTRHMLPQPPALPPRIPDWRPGELFWIVRHGVKFTGMPAWPTTQRDDEVWAMVGFLLQLPRLGPADYAQLAAPPPAGPTVGDLGRDLRQTLNGCARCHGADGSGGGSGAFPRLAGQAPAYLEASLEAFARGHRHSGLMQPVAAGLDAAERRALADHYAALRTPAAPAQPPARSTREGERIARYGIPADGVPSCIHCHGPAAHPRNPFYPKLGGQHAAYLVLQLELFKEGRRGGTPYAAIMHESVDRMSKTQIREVARYYAALPVMP